MEHGYKVGEYVHFIEADDWGVHGTYGDVPPGTVCQVVFSQYGGSYYRVCPVVPILGRESLYARRSELSPVTDPVELAVLELAR